MMDCIGQGQFGVVFKALSRLHGNFVAVKKLALDKDKTGTLMVCFFLLCTHNLGACSHAMEYQPHRLKSTCSNRFRIQVCTLQTTPKHMLT